MMSVWLEICGSFEIKRKFASTLDCSLWSGDLAWPMSSSHMGLIQVSAHVQKYTASWIMNQVRHVFIIFSMLWDILCRKQQVMGNLHLHSFMHFMWIIQDYLFTDSFIVLVQKWKRKRKPENGSLGRYVKLVFCLASWFKRKIILLNVNFRFPILLFCSKENPILLSDRCVLMGVLHF